MKMSTSLFIMLSALLFIYTSNANASCVKLYEHPDYQGTSWEFCNNGYYPTEGNFWDNTISSIQVPEGKIVKVWEHWGTGRFMTYFKSVKSMGGMNDMITSIEIEDFNPDDFTLIFASDPQIDVTNNSIFIPYCTNFDQNYERKSHFQNKASTKSIAGVVMNGDLTSYGKKSELSRFVDQYEDPDNTDRSKRYMIWPGLGNHDYHNSFDEGNNCGVNIPPMCDLNSCASRMMGYLENFAQSCNPEGFDSGSLSYSWDIGNYRFIQLNNFPTFEFDIDGPTGLMDLGLDFLGIPDALWCSTNVPRLIIKPSLKNEGKSGWLVDELARARKAGKKIIINMHDIDEHITDVEFGNGAGKEYLKEALKNYGDIVLAIMVGHKHERVGIHDSLKVKGKDIPIIYGGSTEKETFSEIRFTNNGLHVQNYKYSEDLHSFITIEDTTQLPISSEYNVTLRVQNGNYWRTCLNDDVCNYQNVEAVYNGIGDWEKYVLVDIDGGILLNGDEVALRSYNNTYVTSCIDSGLDGCTVGNTESKCIGALPCETFRIVKIDLFGDQEIRSGDFVAIKASDGKYLRICLGDDNCELNNIEKRYNGVYGWETFNITSNKRSDYMVSLRSGNGNYIRALYGGGDNVECAENFIGGWERFNLVDLNGGDLTHGDDIVLTTETGYSIGAVNGGGGNVVATSYNRGDYETFTIEKQDLTKDLKIRSGDDVALKSYNGKYIINWFGEIAALIDFIEPYFDVFKIDFHEFETYEPNVILIDSAIYGQNLGGYTPTNPKADQTTSLRNVCEDSKFCIFYIGGDEDPFPGQAKNYVYSYKCMNSDTGFVYQFGPIEVPEEAHGQFIVLDCRGVLPQ